MKKLLVIFIAGSFLIACGSGKKSNETKGNDSTKTDTTKTDTSTVNVPKTKDYAYYLGQFKGLTLEGVELEQFSLYEDTAAKNINIIYTVNNADVVGYNKVILALSNCSRLIGEDKTKCMDFTMDNF